MLDQQRGGFAVADTAVSLLNWTHGLTHMSDTSPTAAAMAVADADLARLAGWALHDIGDHTRARQYLALALVHAIRTGQRGLAASILYVLGRISLVEHDPRTALRLFQYGQICAQDAANSVEAARLLGNQAWAYAMTGDHRQTRDSLARAEFELARAHEVEPIEPWTKVFLTGGEFAGLGAVVWHELAIATAGDDPHTAEKYAGRALQLAQSSLASTTPDRPARSILFDHATTAACLFRLGEVRAAVESSASALTLATEISSARALSRLQTMAVTAKPFRRYADVRELRHQVRQLTVPALPRPIAPAWMPV
ncbi:hypothetical protein [Nocardia sp. NPDC059239]|uniref:hypothetical protein n=1 Tax=Nocardia sp. NPDC059239 TaxID=3346785 RepID=UPI0036944FFA